MEQSQLELQEIKLDQRAIKIVDSREPDNIRAKLLETGWIQKPLYSGDFSFWTNDFKHVVVTRKTVSDLLNSIGKLFNRQLEEMVSYYDYKWILLEGRLDFEVSSRRILAQTGLSIITVDQVRNYLADWQHKGFMFDRTSSWEDTVHWLNNKYAYYRKDVHNGSRARFEDDRINAFPSGTRGQVAKECLEKWGSLREVANKEVEDYRTIGKVGEKKSHLLYEWFNKDCREKENRK